MRNRWQRLREAAAASAAPAQQRAGASDGDGDEETVEEMREDSCPTCGGSGKIRDGNLTCPTCHGTGKTDDMKESTSDWEDLLAVTDAEDGWNPDGSLRESTVKRLAEKDYSNGKRVELAKQGKAIPVKNDDGEVVGGAYPIDGREDVKDAVSAYGRNATPETKAHIVKNAKRQKATDELPADWEGSTKESASNGDLLSRIASLEAAVSGEARLRESKPAVLNTTFSTPTRVKSSHGEEGYRVILVREGRGNQEDDQWYTGDAVRELCESGMAEGMQAYANHPSLEEEEDRPERDVKQLVGSYQDVTFKESGGKAQAEAIFVPLTIDEMHPTYGWVITLAEAASRSTAPQPLAGISLYGLSAGEYGTRPDGTKGRLVSMIRPTSGDIVTNAGAGGGFIKQMWESARALRRQSTRKETQPMKVADLQQKIKEAASRLREADSDEVRDAALTELEALQTAEIDAPPKPVDTVEALTEAAPKLVEQIRESAKAEAGTSEEDLRKQLREAQKTLSQFTDVINIADHLREAGVEDEVEQRYFVAQARSRGLREAADIKDMVETERAYQKQRKDELLKDVREATELPDIEGAFARAPAELPQDGGAAQLRESGIPVRDAA